MCDLSIRKTLDHPGGFFFLPPLTLPGADKQGQTGTAFQGIWEGQMQVLIGNGETGDALKWALP
jgi:hypothetical protein